MLFCQTPPILPLVEGEMSGGQRGSFAESLNAIQSLLDEANTDLKSNGASFPFNTTLYSKVASEFSKFNRALAARVAIYRKDWTLANAALTESFFNLTGDLTNGAYLLFSTAGGDLLNPLFFPQNSSGETRVAQPTFITAPSPRQDRSTASLTSGRTSKSF